MSNQNRPIPGQIEERQAPDLNADGKKIRGVIPYGVESRDLGGFKEIHRTGRAEPCRPRRPRRHRRPCRPPDRPLSDDPGARGPLRRPALGR